MTPKRICWCPVLAAALAAAGAAAGAEPYEPTWESLDRHETPRWLQDAKLGVLVYGPKVTQEHWTRSGMAGTVPIPQVAWTERRWDPDEVAQLAVDMGARYVVGNAESYATFLLYPSRYADIEGSPFRYWKGPEHERRDDVAPLVDAVRAKGLRFGLYHNYLNPQQYPYWMEVTQEMLDRYQPLTLWLDEHKLSFSDDVLRSRELLAYYYNHAADPAEVACEDALGSYKRATWQQRLVHGDWFRRECSEAESAISDGYSIRYEEVGRDDVRSPLGRSRGVVANYVHWLAHAVAHGGGLEPAVWWAPQSLWDHSVRVLRQLGDWLKVNGESIYETRPWVDGRPTGSTEAGVRVWFTTRPGVLYAIVADWPDGGRLCFPELVGGPDMRVEMLGSPGPRPWRQSEAGLVVDWREGMAERPDWPGGYRNDPPCDHAFVFRFEPRPTLRAE